MARLTMLAGICVLTMGNVAYCSFNSGPQPLPGTPGYVSPFGSSLTLLNISGVETRNFAFGEPVRFDFEVVNLTSQRQTVQFTDGQDHDFVIVNNGTSQIRWKWSQNMAFTQATTELMFEPNATKTFTLYWPGTLADGTHLPPGTYQARGALVFDGFRADPLAPNAMASELETFTVR